MAQAIPIIPDTLVLLPNERITQLLARWQSIQTTADINQNLATDTGTILHELTILPDRSAEVTNLRTQITNEQTQVTTLRTQVADRDQRIQNLEDEQATALTDAETAEAAMTLLRTQTTQLRNELAGTRATIAVLTRAAQAMPVAGTQHAPEQEKVADPEHFDGTRSKLPNFLMRLQLKAATYTDDQAKLRLAVNYLRGDAADQVRPHVHDGRVNLANLPALITILENAFGNPNRVAEAESKLSTIAQGTRDFSSYYAEFQRHAAEVEWDEPSKLAALKRGLAYRLKNDIIPVRPKPTTLAAYVELCNDLDTMRRQIQGESHAHRQHQAPQPRSQPQYQAPQPRSQATTAGSAAPAPPPPVTTTATGTQAGPMDLSANRRRLSPEERARRMAEGRCYRWGGIGHMVRQCPFGQTQPMRAAAITEAPPPPHITEIVEPEQQGFQ